MKTGKLENGFEYEIDEALLNDYEFLDIVASAVSGEDTTALFKVVNIMFPGEKKAKLLDFARDPETKRVPPEKVVEIVGDVMEDVKVEGKNS